jgi:transposase
LESAPASVTIRAHERGKGGRKKLPAILPRVEVVHDLPEDQKVCGADGTVLERIGEEISEQLDFKPAQARVIRHIRPKYACPCCRTGVAIAPVPLQLLPKSLATPALLAHIATAKFVDGMPLYRQEAQFDRLGVTLGRATMAGWMIKLGGTHVVPVVNLLRELMLEDPLIHCDETRLQVLKSDKAPTADHWMWVRASGPPARRIILFDYDASRKRIYAPKPANRNSCHIGSVRASSIPTRIPTRNFPAAQSGECHRPQETPSCRKYRQEYRRSVCCGFPAQNASNLIRRGRQGRLTGSNAQGALSACLSAWPRSSFQ